MLQPFLQLKNVSKAFQGRGVVTDFSLSLEPEERVCLMGPSGSGKTTLLRLLCGLEEPDSGERIARPGLRFAMVFQENRLIESLDALGNVSLCCRCSPEAVRECLLALDLPEDRLTCPVWEFSGGMKRRVALARALLAPSDVLLLDEPYKGLDEDTRVRVMAQVENRLAGRGLVLVTHDPREQGDCRVVRVGED